LVTVHLGWETSLGCVCHKGFAGAANINDYSKNGWSSFHDVRERLGKHLP